MSNDNSDKFLFDPAAIREAIKESKKIDRFISSNDGIFVVPEPKKRKFSWLMIQPSIHEIHNLEYTHAIFFLENIDLPKNKEIGDDSLSFHRWTDRRKNNAPDIQFACIKIDDSTQFYPKKYIEKFTGELISQNAYNTANALMRLRIFLTCCTLSDAKQFSSPSIVVNHLPHQRISLPNFSKDLENLFQYFTNPTSMLSDFADDMLERKTIYSNSRVLEVLANVNSVKGTRGNSSITDRIYVKYSPMRSPFDEKIIKSSIPIYKKILSVLEKEKEKSKTKLILYFWNFQSAIEESHQHQGLNILLLENCLERLFTEQLNSMNQFTKFHTQAISHYILDELAPNLLPDDEAIKEHMIKLISNLRNNIVHGKIIPDAYAGITIDESFIELKIITKCILYYIVKRLTSEEISLDVLIKELEIKAKTKYPKEWAPDIKND